MMLWALRYATRHGRWMLACRDKQGSQFHYTLQYTYLVYNIRQAWKLTLVIQNVFTKDSQCNIFISNEATNYNNVR
jgi:hypothetical protein